MSALRRESFGPKPKRTLSIIDEAGLMKRDAASRWLSKQVKKPRKKQSLKQGRAS